MTKFSAGILLYKLEGVNVEVLLVHPGGPFWARKDDGAWSVPKGEYTQGDDVFAAAMREFKEETGYEAPIAEPVELGEVNYSNKLLTVWALPGDLDSQKVQSNTFTMQWPPKSGQEQEFPEIDRAAWFDPLTAQQKMVKGQQALIDRLLEKLAIPMPTDVNAKKLQTPDSQLTFL